jgi:hypothetical protein
MGDTSGGGVGEEQAAGHDWKLWMLARADRWLVTAAVLAGLFVTLVVLGVLDPSPLEQAIATSSPVDTLFQAFTVSIITGVTLVVTINQLVLSQELGALGDQRERMAGSEQFRSDVEEATAVGVSPADPGRFLAALVAAAGTRADAVSAAVADADDRNLRTTVDDYAAEVRADVDAVQDRLAESEFGTFDVVWYALDFAYSPKIYEGHRLQVVYADELSGRARRSLDELVDVLSLFGPAREHFKTLYFQWELINLSRVILYSAIPALIVTVSMIVYFDARAVPGATLGISNDVLVISAATTVAVAPFVILLSWVLRIATVTKLTLAMGPFVLQRDGK